MADKIPFVDFGGEGPLLHFAHPNAYPPEAFGRFLTPFTNEYHVIGLEQRPLWPGQQPQDLDDWRLLADDLIRFFDQEGLAQVIGVGHSLGAAVTMLASVKRPDLFQKLVLIDPVFLAPSILEAAAQVPNGDTQNPFVQGALNRRNRWPDKEAAFAHYRPKRVFKRLSDGALWDYVNASVVPDGKGKVCLRYAREWEARFYALLVRGGGAVWDELGHVSRPTLAVRAAETDTLFEEAWQLWQQLQPSATFIELPHVTHLLVLERPLLLAEMVRNWLND